MLHRYALVALLAGAALLRPAHAVTEPGLVSQAYALWGIEPPGPTLIRDAPPGACWGAAACVVDSFGAGGTCEIWLGPGYYTYSEGGRLSILAHEIGHCLGIPGDGAPFFGELWPCLMNDALLGAPNAWDLLMLRHYRPPKHRAFAADLVR